MPNLETIIFKFHVKLGEGKWLQRMPNIYSVWMSREVSKRLGSAGYSTHLETIDPNFLGHPSGVQIP